MAARAIQGATSALLTPASLALIAAIYDDEQERGAAIGTWAAWGALAAVVGPVVGGWLVDVATWRWIFAVNVPLVIVAVVLARISVCPGERMGGRERRIDVVGALLAAFGLAGPVYALVEQPTRGWSDPLVILGLAGGALLLTCFVVYERRAKDPMLPCGLFSRRNFTFTNVETLLVYAAHLVALLLPDDLRAAGGGLLGARGRARRRARDADPLLLLPLGRPARDALRAAASSWGRARSSRRSASLLLVRVDETVSFVEDLLLPMVLFGIGLSLVVAPLTATVMHDAGRGDSGIASGVNNAIARVAALLGIAVVGVAVAGGRPGRRARPGRLPHRHGRHGGAPRGRRRGRVRRDPESAAACALGGAAGIFGAMNLLAHR